MVDRYDKDDLLLSEIELDNQTDASEYAATVNDPITKLDPVCVGSREDLFKEWQVLAEDFNLPSAILQNDIDPTPKQLNEWKSLTLKLEERLDNLRKATWMYFHCERQSKEQIPVCDNCLRASCWEGTFMCDHADIAGVIYKTKEELTKLGLEHPSYWETEG